MSIMPAGTLGTQMMWWNLLLETWRSVCVRANLLQSCPTLRRHGPLPTRLLCLWDSPGKNTGVGCHSLLQGIFPTQGSNPSLLSSALAGGFFTTSCLGMPYLYKVTNTEQSIIKLSSLNCCLPVFGPAGIFWFWVCLLLSLQLAIAWEQMCFCMYSEACFRYWGVSWL